ncbi:MAG: Peptidase T [Candidatus Ordinivivax streblomastigis]|uniref:Peptidase T n=1 Tax=Candidatus Ordinivivax streblomastigis TaxID=2540710 RepID=A0A5M8P0C0_9BACT|nr:MAG: Peptidase T [Candidatus Ordinivivax streblomastigis]
MSVIDRFLHYVSFDTQSSELSDTTPSTDKQMRLARVLKDEVEALGLTEISLDEHAYLMATLPANTDAKLPVIGFIAHLDTSPDMSGANVHPRIVNNYDGTDIVLNEAGKVVLSPAMFPELLCHIGEDIIVTDGTSLLGADDKAGIAEIMTAIQYLTEHPEIKHGKIRIAFNPDEEIGRGASKFDVEKFACDWAYTIDGGEVGELEYENFNAASAKITVKGLNVHPGYAKNKMLNAALIAVQFAGMLPSQERPEHTEGYEGFFHLTAMSGTVEEATLSYIIRDHHRSKFEQRLQLLQSTTDYLNKLYPAGTVQLSIQQQYRNMREIVEPQKHILALAENAMTAVGVTPIIRPIRGGTDGAQLSFKGLPCPNIFAGGLNFHGRYEWIPVQSMEKAVSVIVRMMGGLAL